MTARRKIKVRHVRTAGQMLAAVSAGFLPVASYRLAHEPNLAWYLYPLILCALIFSARSLAEWANRWCHDAWKAWAFTALLEGVMVLSSDAWLNGFGVLLLVSINVHSAYHKAQKKVTVRK